MDRYVPLPPLPPRLSRLNELAYDLWWSWNPEGREVFRRLDYTLWRQTAHNPVLMLRQVSPEMLTLFDYSREGTGCRISTTLRGEKLERRYGSPAG